MDFKGVYYLNLKNVRITFRSKLLTCKIKQQIYYNEKYILEKQYTIAVLRINNLKCI